MRPAVQAVEISPPLPRAGAPPERAPAAALRGPDDVQRGHFGQLTWLWRGGFERVLARTPADAWKSPHQQGWERIKENSRREVWRARLDGGVYYLKYYDVGDWGSRFKGWLQRSAGKSEWRGGLYALRAGIPAVRPVGFTTHLGRDGRRYELLVSAAVEPVYPLNEFWQQVQRDADARRRQADTAQLTERLAELIARAHQSGFEHLDMHAQNILVEPVAPGRYRTLFVDLHSARLGVPIGDQAVVRNLAQLNQWFRRHSSAGARLRLLRAYVRWRNEFEQSCAYGRPLGLTYRELVQALARAAARHAARLWAQRDRRAQRSGRYFARLRLPGGWRGQVVLCTKHTAPDSRASQLVFAPDFWRAQLGDPDRWLRRAAGQSCKQSHSASVQRALLPHASGDLPVIVKRPLARNWRRRLTQLWLHSRVRRAWRMGHALLHRNVPTARPLAALERRRGPLVLDSLLITEAIAGALDLETYLRREQARQAPAAWFATKRTLAALTARHLRVLEQRGFVHRDAKASNILILPVPQPRLYWVDLDGVRRRHRWHGPRAGHRALVCLHVSLLDVPGLTRTDRGRFLREYCARFGTGPRAWRELWRLLVPQVAAKVRAKQARRAWKLARYGRA